MNSCCDLAARIEQLQPEALPRDVARLCLLLSNSVDNLDELDDDDRLCEAWTETGLRLQSATDQHAAMTAELEELARVKKSEMTADDLLCLFRAIKVQGRVLEMYVGQPTAT